MLLVMPPLRVKRWTEREICDPVQNALQGLFVNLYAMRPDASPDGEAEPRLVDLTPTAKDRWVSFANAHNSGMKESFGHERAALAKLEAYGARFSLLSHLVRQSSGETESDYVELPDVENAIELVHWFGGETQRVYQVLSESPEVRRQRMLIEVVRARGGRVTVRELQRCSRLYSSADDWALALELLVRSRQGRWIDPAPGPSGGRPTRIFHLADPVDSRHNLQEES